ncbi:hypothetical protein GGR01_001811 [Acetobacter oeni]|nr:hypothetical protein [Acetobacter oeni]
MISAQFASDLQQTGLAIQAVLSHVICEYRTVCVLFICLASRLIL